MFRSRFSYRKLAQLRNAWPCNDAQADPPRSTVRAGRSCYDWHFVKKFELAEQLDDYVRPKTPDPSTMCLVGVEWVL